MKKNTEKRCRIHNWRQYSQSLVQRGSVTTWFTLEVLEDWLNQQKSGKPGASDHYSDAAIEMILIVKAVFGLGYRQATGFIASIFEAMKIDLQVPHYSTLCRRNKRLDVDLQTAEREGAHILVDSTGAEVFGQDQWHVRRRGNRKGPKVPRDEVIRAVRRHGRATWKVLVGYHQRSLVETTVMRFKGIFGPRLYSRLLQSEVTETRLKCKILNRMASLGLPCYDEKPP